MLYYLCVYVTYMRRGYRVDVFHCRVRGLYIKTGSEQMQPFAEETVLEKENVNEEYVPGQPFDYKVIHSDAYYEQYIEHFVPSTEKRFFYRLFKRIFDIFFSLVALLALLPVMLVIALAIRLDSRGPVIFRQKRIGKGGKPFNCYKFRSMKTDAPHDCATSRLENPKQYQTRVGRVLRRFSLDELPQLWCVLSGTMSMIGYRPLCLTEEKCNNMRARLGVFSTRPGISGYAQVCGRDNIYYKNKAILDAEYVKTASLFSDLILVFKTIGVVLKRDGNSDDTQANKKDSAEVVRETTGK